MARRFSFSSPVLSLCVAALVALTPYAAGCGGDDSAAPDGGTTQPYTVPDGCNPLAADWDCLLPWPSNVFLTDDSSLPSGHRVAVPEPALIHNYNDDPIDPFAFHPRDGFSHLPQILALFPGGVDDADLIFHTDDVTATLMPDATTQIIDADTGEHVLCFAELDPRARDDSQRALVIRPLTRLTDGDRYIVVIQGLHDHTGAAIAPPEGFRRIRDGEATDPPAVAALAPHYESDIFPVLDAAGVDRSKLQLAWDFTVESEENVTHDMLAVRADAIAQMSATPPAVTIDSVDMDPDPHVDRWVHGTIRVPLYLDSADPGARLHYVGGEVAQNGTADVPFVAVIPKSVADRTAGTPPARLVQYGHGFFGSQDELQSGWFSALADRLGIVAVGVDWWGMSMSDVDSVLNDIGTNTGEALAFTDRLHQAMVNQIALAYAATNGTLIDAPEMQVDSDPTYDTSAIYYYGNSNGYILGTTYVSLAPQIDRAVLGVGGVGYSFMMFRAHPFVGFLTVIGSIIHSSLGQQEFASLSQGTFDRIDPITYTTHMLTDTYPNSPPSRRVLLQYGLGDSEVPNLATELHARTLGIPLLGPASKDVAGLETQMGPIDGSALAQYDFGLTPPLPGDIADPPTMEAPPHEGLRRLNASMDQIDQFLRPDGTIVNTCMGVCDPE